MECSVEGGYEGGWDWRSVMKIMKEFFYVY